MKKTCGNCRYYKYYHLYEHAIYHCAKTKTVIFYPFANEKCDKWEKKSGN